MVEKFTDTPKRKLARLRNFNKFRLLGSHLNAGALTKEEYHLYLNFKNNLLSNWDDNSKKLGLKPKIKKLKDL
jgi:hypothetical protein